MTKKLFQGINYDPVQSSHAAFYRVSNEFAVVNETLMF